MPDDFEILEAIARRRRSVRAFLPQLVDRAIIERAVRIAGMAPSSCNTQPWRLHIVSGDKLDALRALLLEAAKTGQAPTPEVEPAAPYQGVYRERQIAAAVTLFQAQGIARDDHAGRFECYLRNYAFFDAPHAAFLFMPTHGGVREAADCGKFAQTFMLALTAAGVGSCPQGSLSDHPQIVRRALALEDEGRLLLGISFGLIDEKDRTADVRVSRANIVDLAHFHNG